MLYLHGICHFYPENLTRSVDCSDCNSAVLFGDRSSAAVVSDTDPSHESFMYCYCDSKSSVWKRVRVHRMRYFQQDNNVVQRFAIHKTTESLRIRKELFPIYRDHFKFTGHQANGMNLSRDVAIPLIGSGLMWTYMLL